VPLSVARLSTTPSRYAFAVVLAGIALALRLALSRYLGPPYILFYPAVMIAAMLGGLGPGLVATAVSAFCAAYWVLPAGRHSVLPMATPDAVGLALFATMGVFTSVVAHLYREARQRAARYEKAVALRHANERLRASEENLRLAQDAAGMGSWEWDLSSGDVVMSERCRALFALAPDGAVTYDLCLSAIHPDDRDRVERALKDALEAREDHAVEMRVPLPDGTVRWVAAKGRGFYGRDGAALKMAGMAFDITAAKRAEEMLEAQRTLEDQVARIAASVPGLVFAFRLRPDGRGCMPFTTPVAEELFGIPRKALAEDVAPLLARVHRDDLERVNEGISASARAMSRWHDEFRYLHPKKGLRWIEGWSVPKGEIGGSVLWHGYATDTTERRRAEEDLGEREAELAAIYENAPLVMMLVDRERRVRKMNRFAEQFGGGSAADLLGRHEGEALRCVNALREPGGCGYGSQCSDCTVRSTILETLETGRSHHLVEASRASVIEGKVQDFTFLLSTTRLAVRGERQVLVTIQDITERTKAEEALRLSDRRKNEFLGVLSHELRNPLAPIRNALFILGRARPGSEQATRAKAVLDRQVGHLARLVDDLLDVTRISRAKIRLQRGRVDLGELVLRAVEDNRQILAEREIALDVRIAPGPIPLDADSTRIAQIIGNLLQNSSKFTDHGGRITVVVEREAGEVSLRVRDTGIGISPEMLLSVFEPFTQADESLHRSRGGLGLGLALVKGLVEMHGGTVEARSDGIGRGAELIVRLPLASDGAGAREPTPEPRPPIRPRRVLIIEDNLDAAETLREMLEMDGHRVEVAHDGRAGLEKARASRPDVVLCDIGLPEMDGYGVARAIRSDPTLASTFLVALTGYALPEDQRRAAQAGFDRHLAKPVSLAQLEEALASILGSGADDARAEPGARAGEPGAARTHLQS
jgi:two-component system CheB/CheR fusion protein